MGIIRSICNSCISKSYLTATFGTYWPQRVELDRLRIFSLSNIVRLGGQKIFDPDYKNLFHSQRLVKVGGMP